MPETNDKRRLNRQQVQRVGLAAGAGSLYFLGFVGFSMPWLAWVCLTPMLWLLADSRLPKRSAFYYSWLFGTITFLGGYTWLTEMLQDFGYLPLPVAWLLLLLLCVAQGSQMAVWGLGCTILNRRSALPLWLTAPMMMVVVEWLYPNLFPSYLANSQFRFISLLQIAELCGPLGLTFLLALSSCVSFELLRFVAAQRHTPGTAQFPVVPVAVFVVLMGLTIGYGVLALERTNNMLEQAASRAVTIGLVQTNMGIYQKRTEPREGLRRHREQSQQLEDQGVDLIIWPESGYHYAISSNAKSVKRQVLGPIQTPLLFGGLRIDFETANSGDDNDDGSSDQARRMYNTAFLTDGEGRVLGTYDKIYLLAFGEYIPLGDIFPWIYKLSPNTSHFDRGQHTNSLVLDGTSYGVLICYEDIIPEFVRKVIRPTPQILVNITNDAWFGDSREPLIHLALSAFRAVENRRFLVRATNTGISAFVGPTGEVLSQTGVFTRENLVGQAIPLSGLTPYARFGNWLGGVCLFGLIIGAFGVRRRRQHL